MRGKRDLLRDYTGLEVAANRVFLMSQWPFLDAALPRGLAFFQNHALNMTGGKRPVAAWPLPPPQPFVRR
jgi:hypothetical protein